MSRQNFDRLLELLASPDGEPRRVLVIGGGILGFGMHRLTAASHVQLVETDVYIGPRTQVVCDAHDLPFADGCFDAVIVQAVLEHVLDPIRVVSEIYRVLRDDGLLYSEIPFMQQVHEGGYDFTRWTLGGHRRLLRHFAEIDAGAVGGPGEALAWSITYYVTSLITAHRIRGKARTLMTALTVPLRWSDRLLGDRPQVIDAASGTFVLARKADRVRSDEEIISAYRGGAEEPIR